MASFSIVFLLSRDRLCRGGVVTVPNFFGETAIQVDSVLYTLSHFNTFQRRDYLVSSARARGENDVASQPGREIVLYFHDMRFIYAWMGVAELIGNINCT